MFTDEQLRMIMSQPDFSSEENVLDRQAQMAQGLRQYGQNGRMDKGSQAARAISGIGAAVGDYYGAKAGMDLGARKRKAMADVFGLGGAGGAYGGAGGEGIISSYQG